MGDQGMVSSCEEYRFLQQLLGLKRRLSEETLEAEEREEIEEAVEGLEKKLRM
jgi:hypothetical protein